MSEPILSIPDERSIVRSEQVRLTSEVTLVGKPPVTHEKPEPKVEIIREGNFIRAVEVLCSCGERIRLRFDYE